LKNAIPSTGLGPGGVVAGSKYYLNKNKNKMSATDEEIDLVNELEYGNEVARKVKTSFIFFVFFFQTEPHNANSRSRFIQNLWHKIESYGEPEMSSMYKVTSK